MLRAHLDKIVVVYLDNILIYLNILAKHKGYVKEVLYYLAKVGLYLKLEKYEFYKKEVEFLGHVISTKGIKIDPKKI